MLEPTAADQQYRSMRLWLPEQDSGADNFAIILCQYSLMLNGCHVLQSPQPNCLPWNTRPRPPNWLGVPIVCRHSVFGPGYGLDAARRYCLIAHPDHNLIRLAGAL